MARLDILPQLLPSRPNLSQDNSLTSSATLGFELFSALMSRVKSIENGLTGSPPTMVLT